MRKEYMDVHDQLPCKHSVANEVTEFFGGQPAPCRDCQEVRRQYRDVYLAMAGNVYALARLARDGLISGSGYPDLAALNNLGTRLHREMDPAYADAIYAETLELLTRLSAEVTP